MTPKKLDFIRKVIPLSQLISEWTQAKSEFVGIQSKNGIFASLVMAEIVIQSEWGLHPIAKYQFKTVKDSTGNYSTKYSNNLVLLQPEPGQKVKVNTYNDIDYIAFKDWKTFAIGYSDHLVFSGKYKEILEEETLLGQIDLFSLTKTDSESYNSIIKNTITICSEVLNVRQS